MVAHTRSYMKSFVNRASWSNVDLVLFLFVVCSINTEMAENGEKVKVS